MLNDKPRSGNFAEKNGSYEQAFRLKASVISPGDKIEIEQYFTGYGEIKSVKTVCYPSDDIFDNDQSYLLTNLKETKPGLFIFGGEKKKFTDSGITLCLRGLQKESWDESTLFVDIGNNLSTQILTETKQEKAPIEYHLLTQKSIRPGSYYIDFYFTYYNGNNWISNSKSINFKVQNFFERNDTLLGWIALLATASALVRFSVIPFINWLIEA